MLYFILCFIVLSRDKGLRTPEVIPMALSLAHSKHLDLHYLSFWDIPHPYVSGATNAEALLYKMGHWLILWLLKTHKYRYIIHMEIHHLPTSISVITKTTYECDSWMANSQLMSLMWLQSFWSTIFKFNHNLSETLTNCHSSYWPLI